MVPFFFNFDDESERKNVIKDPTVFISYSWDDDNHKNWVLKLSDKLISNGVNVILDQYDLDLGADMHYFMENALSKSDKVLIVFTPNYKAKAEKRINGVGFEYSIITANLYRQITTNKKFIPILTKGNIDDCLPDFIQRLVYLDMREAEYFERKYIELLNWIYGRSTLQKPSKGKNPFEESIQEEKITRQSLNTDQTYVECLKEIKSKTNYLWKEFEKLDIANSLEASIRDSVLISITSSLNHLELSGHLSYEVEFSHNMAETAEKVHFIYISGISPQLKNLVKLIIKGKI